MRISTGFIYLLTICLSRFLVLGGEQFPSTKEAITWQNWESGSRKRIFNIYGTTEMSCWAMIHEVTLEDLRSGEVPLGQLLSETQNAFLPNSEHVFGLEEIVLTSKTRICCVDDKDVNEDLNGDHLGQVTGDLVKRSKDGKIVYYGRKNEIIKKFGEKVNLNTIEAVATEVVSAAACIYMQKKIVLFLKVEDEHLTTLLKRALQAKLKPIEIPDEVRKVSFYPLSANGKVSKQKLKEIYKELMDEDRKQRFEAEDTFLEAVNQIFNMRLSKPSHNSDEPDGKRMRTEMDLTFKALGGTSFDALRISMKLEDQVGFSNGLLPKLLSDKFTLRDICFYLKDLKRNKVNKVNRWTLRPIPDGSGPQVIRRYNLDKCIDATPALLQCNGKSFISVGSHSHKLITIDPNSLNVVSQTELGNRIEGEVSLLDDNGLVGCYDGHLYCFNLQSGALKWKFNSHGMIKSKAIVVDGSIIFGNYNYEKNLWCLQYDADGEILLKWKVLIGSRGILSSPIIIQEASVLICTLDGTCELLACETGSTIWNKKFESPIFSSPQQIPRRNEIVIAEVTRIVNCINFDGDLLWKFETEGHIFSSFLFHQVNEEGTKIFFGCHDKKLRCLNYNYQIQSPNLQWSVELQSQIFGTPKKIVIDSEEFLVSCTTNGVINAIKLSDGSIAHSLNLPGEIFSSPVIHKNQLFVGCRDNYLYCIQF